MPAKSEKQANLFRAALGNPKPGTGAAKIKSSMPREKIKHFTKVGESDDVCETCGGIGWYATAGKNGEPEQVQCQDCYGTGKKPSVGEGTMETLGEDKQKRYTPEQIAAVIWKEEKRPGNQFFNWLSNAFDKAMYKNIPWGMNPANTEFVGKSLQKLGYSRAQVVDVRNVLVELAKRLTDYYVKRRGARNDAFGSRPDPTSFALYGPERWLGDKKSHDVADSFQTNLKKLFIKKLAQREDLLVPDVTDVKLAGIPVGRTPNGNIENYRRISADDLKEQKLKELLRPIITEVLKEQNFSK